MKRWLIAILLAATAVWAGIQDQSTPDGPYPRTRYLLPVNETAYWDDVNEIFIINGELDVNGITELGDGGSTNYTAFDVNGTMTMVGEATVWDDLRIVPGSFDRPGAKDPAYVAYDVNGAGTSIYLTEWAKNDVASFTVQLPHSYDEGEDLYVHIHWTAGANGAGESGNAVGWKIIYSWANIDGTWSDPATADLSDACSGTDHQHQMTDAVQITGTGKTISSMLICNITRTDTGTDDTWSGSGVGNIPMLLEADFHFPMDTIGSGSGTSK